MTTHGLALPLLLTVLLFLVALAPSSSVTAAGGTGRRPGAACTSTYTLRVKTACGSPAARTSDAVSVAFGDAYRNEVLARPLVVPTAGPGPGSRGRALERCGTDTFRVAGPCGYGVCCLYLHRDGRDGWAPEWVQSAILGDIFGSGRATLKLLLSYVPPALLAVIAIIHGLSSLLWTRYCWIIIWTICSEEEGLD